MSGDLIGSSVFLTRDGAEALARGPHRIRPTR